MPPIDDTAPISLDSAVSMLLPADPVAKTADGVPVGGASAPAEPVKTGAEAASEPSLSGADEVIKPTASADGNDKPAQDDVPAATADDVDPGSLPLIEAPAGWTAEEKEVFKSSPRKVQEAFARREQERTTELRNGQNATAEERKAVAGEVSALKGLNVRLQASITEQVNTLARDFPEIKTQADIDALAASDPARFAVFQAGLMRFNAAAQAQTEAQQVLQAKAQEQNRAAMKSAHEALVKIFPTWSDAAVATKEVTELQDYAISIGASEQGARALHDPIVYKLAHKAMLYDRAQKARAEAVNREAPRTVTPGASTPPDKGARSAAERSKALAKLDKSGDIEDAMSLMTVNSR